MDALRAFELGAKAGRAYVRAIRQAWAEAFAEAYKDRPMDPESDYYASRLGVAEEGGEALEPAVDPDRYTTASMHALIDARWCGEHATTWGFCKHKPHGITPVWTDPPADDDRCNCMAFGDPVFDAEYCSVHNQSTVRVAGLDVTRASLDELGDSLQRITDTEQSAFRSGGQTYETGPRPHISTPPVPSSSAGRGVGSPGVSAGAEESAPPGWRSPGTAAADAVREVMQEHRFYVENTGVPFDYTYHCATGLGCLHERFESRGYPGAVLQWADHVAAEVQSRIDGGVGATPTPKPAEPTTFPCVVTGCPKRFAGYDELNTHSYWMHLEPDPFKTNEDPLVRYERYPGATPTGDFKWFSIKVTYPKSKAQK